MKLVSFFVLALLAFPSTTFAAPIIELTADKTNYSVNEVAAFRVHLLSAPVGRDLEFFVDLRDAEGTPVALTADLAGDLLGTSQAFESIGTYVFTATTYIQNKNVAAALVGAITFYQAQIADIDTQIDNATSPEELELLMKAREESERKLQASEAELAKHRVLVNDPAVLSIQVQ